MEISILANEISKQEMLKKGLSTDNNIHWLSDLSEFNDYPDSDLLVDMNFERSDPTDRVAFLLSVNKPVLINAVSITLASLNNPGNFIRINGWNGFIERNLIEISASAATINTFGNLLESLGWKYIATPDILGFYSARVIAAIINEAYYTLDDGVSSKEEIDIAMKLGTNYPYGPFEWAVKIGLDNIYRLLLTLSREDKRYTVAPSLINELNLS